MPAAFPTPSASSHEWRSPGIVAVRVVYEKVNVWVAGALLGIGALVRLTQMSAGLRAMLGSDHVYNTRMA